MEIFAPTRQGSPGAFAFQLLDDRLFSAPVPFPAEVSAPGLLLEEVLILHICLSVPQFWRQWFAPDLSSLMELRRGVAPQFVQPSFVV